MFSEELLEILHEIGIYVEQIKMDYKIEDLIEDSLSYISFFIELESRYNIEFPEDFFAVNIYQMSFAEVQTIVDMLMEGKEIDSLIKGL